MKNHYLTKLLLTVIFILPTPALLYAQTQYNHYDDSKVVGGADIALNGIVIILILVIAAIFLLFVTSGVLNVYYWFNPEANPDYKINLAAKEKEVEKAKEKHIQNMNMNALYKITLKN